MAQYVKVSENVVNSHPTTVAYLTSPEVSILQEVEEKMSPYIVFLFTMIITKKHLGVPFVFHQT